MNHIHSPDTQRGKGRPRNFDRSQALARALEIFWRCGYEPTSITELCRAMEIKPPSLYATFGNKAQLFIEAIHYYEAMYWDAPARNFMAEPDLFRGVYTFFKEAARILLSPDSPCGCMVVLAAINISDKEHEVIAAVQKLRLASKQMFADRLQRAVQEGQLPAGTDTVSLAGALNAMLEGLSVQARDGLSVTELTSIAAHALRLLPQ